MSTIERFDLEFGIVTQVGGKQISKLSVTHVRIRTGGGAPASPKFFVTPTCAQTVEVHRRNLVW